MPHSAVQVPRGLAVVTGASSGIGQALARRFAEEGFDLLLVADDEAGLRAEAQRLGVHAAVETVTADLAGRDGPAAVHAALRGRPVAVLAANAGVALGHQTLDQDWPDLRRVIDTNVVGTLDLIHRIGRDMRALGHGGILVTSSLVSRIPGPFDAVYNATKAFLHSFALALRNELKDSGVSVTTLMPGATDTQVFQRADMADTLIANAPFKSDPDDVARAAYSALMRGDADVVPGLANKALAAAARVVPDTVLAEIHRQVAKPRRRGNT